MRALVNTRTLISSTSCIKRVVSALVYSRHRANSSVLCLPSQYRVHAVNNNISSFTKAYQTRWFSSGVKKKPVLTLFTNDDCTLCDEAMKELSPFLDQVEVEHVDITLASNKEWYEKYKYDIPVFHLDGEFLMKHKADLELFKQKLSELKNQAK